MEKLCHLLKRVKLRQSVQPEGSSAQHARILGMEGSGRWICVCVFKSYSVLGLCCCVSFSLVAVCRLLIVVTSLVVEHRL